MDRPKSPCSRKVSTLLLLTTTIACCWAWSGSPAWGHTDPSSAAAPGVFGALFAFRDAAGTVPVSGSVRECDTIYFQAVLAYQPEPMPGVIGSAFEEGLWRLFLPDGADVNITPPGGVPCVGGTTDDPNSASNAGRGLCANAPLEIRSDLIPYRVTGTDAAAGFLIAQQRYGDPDPASPDTAYAHIGAADLPGIGVITPIQIKVDGCDDGNACTIESCDPVNGCSHTTRVCQDGNPCTHDSCDTATGCRFIPIPAACSDGNPCTVGDSCRGGFCVGGPVSSCDDGNACTSDSCQPVLGCVHVPRTCSDGNPCTDDSCSPAAGCVFAPNTTPCSDGNACTVGDACGTGSCRPGTPLVCNDGSSCTADSCDPVLGCVFAPGCNDNNPCTTETCVGNQCVSVPTVCNDGNPCTDDRCDPAIGCVYTPDDTNPCTDGSLCTTDACIGGQCRTTPVACTDGNPCTTDTCDPATGCRHACQPAGNPACEIVIGDFIWNDANADGQQSGEAGVGNVTVHLYDCSGAPALIGTDTTDGSGSYEFRVGVDPATCSLAPRSLYVDVADSNFSAGGALAGFLGSPQNQGPDSTDSDCGGTNRQTACASYFFGTPEPTVDCGFREPEEEVCRTAAWWAGHAEADPTKPCSRDLTAGIVTIGGGSLSICGECIANDGSRSCSATLQLNDAASAIEAMCIRTTGGRERVARQLTAAALNCVASGGTVGCEGSAVGALFADCNAACDGNPATPATRSLDQCVKELDCWNSGYSGIDSRNQCIGPTGCQQRPLPLAEINDFLCLPLCTDSLGDFIEGPSGSNEECAAASSNSCLVVPPGESLCRRSGVFQDSCR